MKKKRNKKFNKNKYNFFTYRIYIQVFIWSILFSLIAVFIINLSSLYMFEIDTVETNVSIDRNIMSGIKGKSIISVNTSRIYNQMRRRYPEAKEIYIRKKFPSTLSIEVLKRKPFAQVEKDGFYILDEERVVIRRRIQNSYPGIFIIEIGNCNISFPVGKPVNDKRICLAYKLIKELNESSLINKFKITSINVAVPYSTSFIMNNINVIIGKDDFGNKLRLLEKLLDRKFNNNVDSIRYIDLRYASSDDNIYIGNKR